MAQGLDRRTPAKDRLATKQGIEPVRLTGPGVRTPNMPVQRESMSSKLNTALGKWAGNTLQAIADKEHAKADMDGKMAAVQGQTLEQLELDGGDKWALNGHRVMTAQTISSALVAARRQEIEDADFALDPDEFRQKFVDQLGQAVEGQDPRTARLIQEQMMGSMPDLVARHTLANTAYLERQNFEAVKTAIDIQSRDAQGLGNLVNIARGGVDSPSSGLSAARLSNGVTEGVVLAYTNDNPRAFDLLSIAGIFDGYSTEQLNRMNNARKQWQTRRRQEYNRTRIDRQLALDARSAAGDLEPGQAIDEQIALNLEFEIETDNDMAMVAARIAIDPNRTMDKTRINVMEAALISKDYPALAAASESILRFVESGNIGNSAIGPVVKHGVNKGQRATTSLQVMPITAKDPGFGIRPSDGTLEDNERVGSDLWKAHVVRYEGDLELAAIAYHAGHTRVQPFLDSGRNYDSLPQPATSKEYWRKFEAERDRMEHPLAGDKFNKSVEDLATAKEAFNLEAYAVAALAVADLDARYELGKMPEEEWLAKRDAIMSKVEGMKTEATVRYEIKVSKDMLEAAAKEAGKRLKAGQEELLAEMMIGPTSEFLAVMNDEKISTAKKGEALLNYRQDREAILKFLEIPMTDAGRGKFITQAGKILQSTVEARQKFLKEEAQIGLFIKEGRVSDLKTLALRTRAYDRMVENETKSYRDAFEASGGNREAAVVLQEGLDQIFPSIYSNAGEVDSEMRAVESAIALSPLFNAKGEINEQWAPMIDRYKTMIRVDEYVSRGYLTADARTRVNAVLKIAGTVGSVEDAMSQFVMKRETDVSVDLFTQQVDTQRRISAAVAAKLEFDDTRGLFQMQALFTSDADRGDDLLTLPSEYARAGSAETTDEMSDALEFELGLVYALNPDIDPDLMIETAQQNLNRHSAIIGGSFVNMSVEPMKEFFGAQANQYAKSGIEHEVVLGWLNSDAVKADHLFIDQQGLAEQFPDFAQDFASGGLFGVLGQFGRGMGLRESRVASHRGVRPFKAFTNPAEPSGLYVQIFLPTGNWSQPILVDMKEAGRLYMEANPARG